MFHESRIVRFSDLENNDSLSAYDNSHYLAQQTHKVYEIFYTFLEDIKPKRIIEIGTGLGGFTMFLATACKELGLDTKIFTYDVNDLGLIPSLSEAGVHAYVENIFSGPNPWEFHSIKQEVIDMVKEDGVTLVLCDGLSKIQEFKLFSPILKSNDIIMCHDYAHDADVFQEKINKNVWNWHEISYSDIESSINENNLTSYKADILQNCAWFAAKKQ